MATTADMSYLERLLALVGDRETLTALEESAARVEAAVRRVGAEGLKRPFGPGKWTGAQVLAHLADAELASGFRARQVLTEQPHTVQEYDETAWIGLYREIDVDAALASFVAARRWNLEV